VESDQIVSMSSKKRDARERRRDVKKIERSSETTSALNSVFFSSDRRRCVFERTIMRSPKVKLNGSTDITFFFDDGFCARASERRR
jgi:hypothetical protein